MLVLITGLMRYFFHDAPPDSFADLYLAAVLIVAYRASWRLAAALAGVSLLLSFYLLVPLDRSDGYLMGSYSVCAAVIVAVMATFRRSAVRA